MSGESLEATVRRCSVKKGVLRKKTFFKRTSLVLWWLLDKKQVRLSEAVSFSFVWCLLLLLLILKHEN